jgi:hypoxanthine phosphoribosyltransferase
MIRPLIDRATLGGRIAALAQEMAPILGPEVVLLALLEGSLYFALALAQALQREGVQVMLRFNGLSSYGGSKTSQGTVRETYPLPDGLEGARVLLVDDIFDSGRTLQHATDVLAGKKLAMLKTAVLLQKQGKATEGISPDFVGFSVPDQFLIGFGLDLAGKYRALPYVGVLEE